MRPLAAGRARTLENESLLEASLKPGFKMVQVTGSGEVDATEDHRQRLHKAIVEYQHVGDMLGPTI